MTSALIDTTNRLLGGSINDLSLYGGQVAVKIGAPEPLSRHPDGLSVPDPTHFLASRTIPVDGPAEPEAFATGEPHGEAQSSFYSTPFAPTPIQFGDPVHAAALDAHVPAAPGSGAPAMSMEVAHAPAMLPTAMPASLVPPTLTAAADATLLPPASALAALGGLAAPVLALSEIDNSISSLVTTTDTLLDQAQQAVDALPPIADIIGAEGFLGNDPIGGVATLVSMVDSTDAFDLAHAGIDTPAVTATGSILDTLADETVAGALLGDVAHGVDTLLPDHEHHGVLGL